MDIIFCKGYVKKHYPLYLSSDPAFDDFFELLPDTGRKIIIVDAAIKHHFDSFIKAFGVSSERLYIVEASEATKTFSQLEKTLQKIFSLNPNKSDIIVAIGGGVILNLAGLAASLAMRGLQFCYIPTTITAQIDVCTGSKQAVNFKDAKNWVGLFNDPAFCYINPNFTLTQSSHEVRSQSIEGMKLCLATDKLLLEKYIDNIQKLVKPDIEYRQKFVNDMVKLKTKVIKKDLLEKGPGLSMLYGHTVGHAVEMLEPETVNHGTGVGIGMLVAARISNKMGIADQNLVNIHLMLLEKLQLSTVIPADISLESIMQQLKYDKKSRSHQLQFVLLKGVGEVAKNGSGYLFPVKDEIIRSALKETY